jgi:hypothetical protein
LQEVCRSGPKLAGMRQPAYFPMCLIFIYKPESMADRALHHHFRKCIIISCIPHSKTGAPTQILQEIKIVNLSY